MVKIKQDELSIKGFLIGALRTLWAVVGAFAVTLGSIISYNWDDLKTLAINTSEAVQFLSIQVAELNKNTEHVIYLTEENKTANKEQDARILKNEKEIQKHDYQIDRLNDRVFAEGF